MLTGIAAAHGKTVAQVALRWLTQLDVVAIPKSVRRDRMEQNFDIFDFTLSDGQMSSIAGLDTGAGLFIDHEDHVYVVDSYNHRVQMFRYFGQGKPAAGGVQ